MMDKKALFVRVLNGIKSNDSQYCGDAPQWMKERIIKNGDELLTKLNDASFESQLQVFALGAGRYLADQGGVECDTIGNWISALVTR